MSNWSTWSVSWSNLGLHSLIFFLQTIEMKEFFQRFPKRCFELEKSKKKNSSGIPKNPHLKNIKPTVWNYLFLHSDKRRKMRDCKNNKHFIANLKCKRKKRTSLRFFVNFFLQNREKEFRILLTEDLVSSKSGWLDVP